MRIQADIVELYIMKKCVLIEYFFQSEYTRNKNLFKRILLNPTKPDLNLDPSFCDQ